MTPHTPLGLLLAFSLSLTACSTGPQYERPAFDLPAQYKTATPLDAATPQTPDPSQAWWQVYQDPQLNTLQNELLQHNPSIAQAQAQYRQAQALLTQAQAGLWPSISANAGLSRGSSVPQKSPTNAFSASLNASWELDLWGSVSHSIDSDTALAQASLSQISAAKLSAQNQLTQAYLQWVVTGFQLQALKDSAKSLEEALALTENQFRAGLAAESAVAQAQSQWHSAQAQVTEKALTHDQLHNAIATTLGRTPSQLTLQPVTTWPARPDVPPGLPSTLLERRPDIAAAERKVASANAEIGVAQAARYPKLTLSASAGSRSSALENWLSLPNRVWALGPELAYSLFDTGKRKAQVAAAEANYDAIAANYKQTVLKAFQEVEDNLTAQTLLAQTAKEQSAALAAAQKAESISLNQYKAGTVAYLNVLNAQNSRIAAENALWSVWLRQYTTHAALITALGGAPNSDARE